MNRQRSCTIDPNVAEINNVSIEDTYYIKIVSCVNDNT